MKMRAKMTPAALGLAIAGLACGGAADAAVAISPLTFDKSMTTQILKAMPDSFYNDNMGYLGWAMQSGWGNVKLKKGNVYTITAVAAKDSGIHPAIGVWIRPQGSGLVPNTYAYDHMYNQWENIFAKNVMSEDVPPKKLGTLKQFFVTNGVDRDGWELTDPEHYDQSLINRIIDSYAGTVVVQFRAPENGWYQFVVGAMNPDSFVDKKQFQAIQVTVDGL